MTTNKANNYKPLGLRSKMPFGKYKGKMLVEIKEINPGYIDWLWDNKIVHLKKEVTFKKMDDVIDDIARDEFPIHLIGSMNRNHD
jgi:hypothetical protein